MTNRDNWTIYDVKFYNNVPLIKAINSNRTVILNIEKKRRGIVVESNSDNMDFDFITSYDELNSTLDELNLPKFNQDTVVYKDTLNSELQAFAKNMLFPNENAEMPSTLHTLTNTLRTTKSPPKGGKRSRRRHSRHRRTNKKKKQRL